MALVGGGQQHPHGGGDNIDAADVDFANHEPVDHPNPPKLPQIPDLDTNPFQADILNNKDIISQRPSLIHLFQDLNDASDAYPDTAVDPHLVEQQSTYFFQNSKLSHKLRPDGAGPRKTKLEGLWPCPTGTI